MRILIIDDDQTKRKQISAFLSAREGLGGGIVIRSADALSDAVRLLNSEAFDLIVLDLMLPYIPLGTPDSGSGLELLRQIRKHDGPNRATTLIGLSAFPDEIQGHRAAFEQFGVLLASFEDQDRLWTNALGQIADDIANRTERLPSLDFLIFVALEEEFQSYRDARLRLGSRSITAGLYTQYVEDKHGRKGAIIHLRSMGLSPCTFEVATALRAFKSKVVCMSGICAGFAKEVELGQLVVRSPAWEYQVGRWSKDGFEMAPHPIPLRPDTKAIIEQTIASYSFLSSVEEGFTPTQKRPAKLQKPVLCPAATGSAVIC